MPSSAIAIKVQNLSKAYQLGEIGTGTISRDIERWWAKLVGKQDPFLKIGETSKTPNQSNLVWSLNNINFTINKGETIGIIGKNGAGKSTLLKILSKVTSPTSGKIYGSGRIASLLEVGTGFNPELTGRENVYLNGSILGMRKHEIAKKFEEILDFSGVGKYIDTPVKRYSSGMYVRLAFAVAAHLESEILVIDEVLAVGDAEFQKKCLGKISEINKEEGRTVLFVSHNMGSIAELCNRTILLENGKLKLHEQTDKVISHYINNGNELPPEWNKAHHQNVDPNFDLLTCYLVNFNGEKTHLSTINNNEKTGVFLKFEIAELHQSLCFGIAVYNHLETLLFWSYNTDKAQNQWVNAKKGINEVIIWLPTRLFNEGSYTIRIISSLHFIRWILAPNKGPALHIQVIGGLSDSPIWNDARPGQLAPILDFEEVK